jgi:hypothetical protein
MQAGEQHTYDAIHDILGRCLGTHFWPVGEAEKMDLHAIWLPRPEGTECNEQRSLLRKGYWISKALRRYLVRYIIVFPYVSLLTFQMFHALHRPFGPVASGRFYLFRAFPGGHEPRSVVLSFT